MDPRLQTVAKDAKVKTCHVYHCWHAIKALGEFFDPVTFAQFAGLEDHHVAAICQALKTRRLMPVRRETTKAKATRIAMDFVIPIAWIDWARENVGWPEKDAREEAAIFVNYWCARSDDGAAKLNWDATWQNWCRRSKRIPSFAPTEAVTWDETTKREYLARISGDAPVRFSVQNDGI